MDNFDARNTTVSVSPINNEFIDMLINTENLEDENKINPQSGYLSHFTSIRYPFAGMIRDVKIRLPYYLSDWKLGFSYRISAATIRIFFLNTIPELAYALDSYLCSEQYYGVNEALRALTLGGIVFGLLAVQPISIVGFTGLISLFNYSILLARSKLLLIF